MVDMVLPSAVPAICLEAIPITFPMSFILRLQFGRLYHVRS